MRPTGARSSPVLHSERLYLRPVTLQDAPAIQRAMSDPEVVGQLSASVPWPYPEDGAETFLRDHLLPACERGDAHAWVLIPREGPDEAIGLLEYRCAESTEATGDRGFWLARPWWGRGLMTEAVQAFQDWVFLDQRVERLRFASTVQNARSRRVKEKTGARPIGEVHIPHHHGDGRCTLWELTRERWAELRAGPAELEGTGLLGHLPDPVVLLDDDDRVCWVNTAATLELGWSAARVIGRTFMELLAPGDRPTTLTGRFRTRHGPTLDHRMEWTLADLPSGGRICSGRDLTTTLATKDRLREDLALWDLASEVAGLGFWTLDTRTLKVSWSRQVYVIHGLDPDQPEPDLQAAIDVYHPEDRPLVEEYVQEAIETGEPWHFRLRILRPDGAIRTVVSSSETVQDAEGRTTRVFGVFLDLTEELEVNERALQAERLEASNKLLERFAAVVSHDLRAPLRGIRQSVAWLKDDLGEVEGELAESLHFIVSRSARLERMIEGALQYSRVAGQGVAPEPVDTARLVDTLAGDHPPGVVTRDALPTVLAGRTQLLQVFGNLVNNALEHGGRRVHVGHQAGEVHRFEVDDDGPGIPPDLRKEVFEIYRTLRSRDDHESNGLGLTIVRTLVERMGGRVGVGASPLGGARLWFELPIHAPEERP